MLFFHIGNFIIPTDEVIFFRGVGIPPTSTKYTKQYFHLLDKWWLSIHPMSTGSSCWLQAECRSKLLVKQQGQSGDLNGGDLGLKI